MDFSGLCLVFELVQITCLSYILIFKKNFVHLALKVYLIFAFFRLLLK